MSIKKLFGMVIALLVIYIFMQISFKNLNHGHTISYELITDKKKFSINETYTQNYDDELDGYYIEIAHNENIFNFQTMSNFKKENYIIEDVYYYENEKYKCIYPIFKTSDTITDIICKEGTDLIDYTKIKGIYPDIDTFASSIELYNSDNYIDNKDDKIEKDSLIYYKNNRKNEYISIENYKGIYLLNNDIENIKLFNKDIYTKNISGFIDKYYVVADYNKEYSVNEIYLINIKDGSKTTLTRDNKISLDSYVQGIVDNKLYFIDKDNKIQYEITLSRINKIGSINDDIKVYQNKKWSRINFNEALNIKFDNYSIDTQLNNIKYEKVDKYGNNVSGYYYMYENDKDEYKVYKSNIQNPTYRKYLFNTTSIDNIVYIEDAIYYVYKDSIYRYSDNTLSKVIVEYPEIKFNKNLKFGIYVEK